MYGTNQKEAGTNGHPANPPEPTRIETEHDVDVVAETVGTYRHIKARRICKLKYQAYNVFITIVQRHICRIWDRLANRDVLITISRLDRDDIFIVIGDRLY